MARQQPPVPSPAPRGRSGATPVGAAKKPRWYRQVWQVFTATRAVDKGLVPWILGTFFGVMAVAAVIGLLVDRVVYALVLALGLALLAALFVLVRRAEAAAYRRIEGQPGASLSALRSIRRGWDFPEEPAAIDPRTQDLVFRGVGRAGVVLVGEGPAARIGKLLEAERRKIARILPNVPITLMQTGDGEGQVPLNKLARKVQRLKPTLTKQEVAEISKRLRALGGLRMPVPKGMDPTRVRPDRKGMRGR